MPSGPRRWTEAICAALFALACAVPAVAEGLADCRPVPRPAATGRSVPEVIGTRLFDDLIAWIAINTSYDMLLAYTDPPSLSFCRVGDLIVYEHADLLVDPALFAAFDRERRHIFLTEPWSMLNLFDQSVLLHELIHDVQLSNRDWPCRGAPELEAYYLQDRWLQEHGIRHPFDWDVIRFLSHCADDAR
ncbi:hypothetical protein HKCCSP123_16675 [Rhodobacterales bacterium HKCCSP123]|nr:hypothetical protein [Rhodobacterales bacterium HKCCSP123]